MTSGGGFRPSTIEDTTMTTRPTATPAAEAAVLPPELAKAAGQAPMTMPALPPGLNLQGDEQIAMLLYPGMTALDFAGPYHFLALTGAKIHLVTNQKDLTPVASDLGMAIQPTVTMEDCPTDVTVLFAPGGMGGTLAAASDPATLAFVRDRGSRARYVTSVCTGSLVLGAAGLLHGKRATSHFSVVPLLSHFGALPTYERVVMDGNVITGAGVSAGLDFGSALVEALRGRPMAELGVLISEYEPAPPIRGGSLATARPEIAQFAQHLLTPLVEGTKALNVLA
jgi:cyclohexyl-isocyanide hydratase